MPVPAKAQASSVPAPAKAYFFGETKQIVNGQVIQDSAIKSEYNGKILHIDERDNNKIKHYSIKNKKILKKLLANPINNLGLFERLSNDFYIKPQQRTVKHRHSKHRHSKHRHSKHRHSKHRHSKHRHRHSKHRH